jgi:hypothetical protein
MKGHLSRDCTEGVEEVPVEARAVHFAENRQASSEDSETEEEGILWGYEDSPDVEDGHRRSGESDSEFDDDESEEQGESEGHQSEYDSDSEY